MRKRAMGSKYMLGDKEVYVYSLSTTSLHDLLHIHIPKDSLA